VDVVEIDDGCKIRIGILGSGLFTALGLWMGCLVETDGYITV
jgi:hypothetical protein